MKRIFIVLFTLFVAAGVSAQVCEGLNVITLRVGDNLLSSPDAGTPHMSLAYEYELVTDAFDIESLCLGAGGSVGFCYFRRSLNYPGYYFAYNNVSWALRGTVHYDLLGQLLGMHNDHVDTYATLSLGMEHSRHAYIDKSTGGVALNQEGGVKVPTVWSRRLLPGIQLGVRYWFTPNFGAVAEAGCDGLSFFNVGLSVCF